MTEVQSINTSNMEIENPQQESQTKLLTVKSINNSEDLQTIIFDLGAYNYRIGYSGNDRPSFIFPPIKFNEKDDYEFLTSQKGDGYFNDVKKFEDFFDDFISDKELNTSLNQGSILFSEPIIHNKTQRMDLTQFLFEKYEIGGLFFCNNSVLSSFSYGKSSCIVFDSGHSQSNVVPVHDGMIIKNGINFFNLNGINIEEIIINDLINKQIKEYDAYNILQKIQIISDLKEIIFTPEENKENKKYVLPDKKNIEINDDFISILKKEIENKLFNEEKGNLKSIILKSISSVLLDIKKELINNIFICGGNSLIFNNYFKDLKDSLAKQLVAGTVVKLTTHPSKMERTIASFLGASIISSLNIYKETIVKKEEYEEHGAIIIEKKCA
jgi:actin-related protein